MEAGTHDKCHMIPQPDLCLGFWSGSGVQNLPLDLNVFFSEVRLRTLYLQCAYTWWLSRSVGASVSNTFGPLILNGLGFDAYTTSLLNVPFGAVQLMVILLSSYAAYKFRTKSIILIALVLPVIAGLVMLYGMPESHIQQVISLVERYSSQRSVEITAS
jgi:hypothetical protein